MSLACVLERQDLSFAGEGTLFAPEGTSWIEDRITSAKRLLRAKRNSRNTRDLDSSYLKQSLTGPP